MAGPGPVFEFDGAQVHALVDDCVVAPAGAALPTLVAVDNSRNLTWRGRSNLYSRIRVYLSTTGKVEGAEVIDDFSRWKESATEVREVDSVLASTPVWRSTKAHQDLVLDQENPTRAFQLATAYLGASSFGARSGPFGERLVEPTGIAGDKALIMSEVAGASGAPGRPIESTADATKAARPSPAANVADPALPRGGLVASGEKSTHPSPEPDDEEMTSLPAMPPMSTSPTVDVGHSGTGEGQIEARTASETGHRRQSDLAETARKHTGEILQPEASKGGQDLPGDFGGDIIRSADQFINTMNRYGTKGGTLRLARGAEIELPATDFTGAATWLIDCEPGSPRPRIRFRPSVFASRPLTAWSVLLNLRGGVLQIHGVDIVTRGQTAEAFGTGPQAAIGVCGGTRLELTDCTITVADPSTSTAAIVVQPRGAEAAADKSPAIVKLTNCFVRTGGNCLTAGSGRLLDVRLKNVLVSSAGSLLHALGRSQVEGAGPSLKATIDRSLISARGGLVYLESSLEESELPLTVVEATSSIFSTAGLAPLLRVDGQGQADRLRDLILYKADKVAYDQITTYRRDQILQTGVSPRDYSRSDWRTAFDPKDESPVTEGVKFRKKIGPGIPAWSLTKDDLELDTQSASGDRGPDLNQIPSPPAPES